MVLDKELLLATHTTTFSNGSPYSAQTTAFNLGARGFVLNPPTKFIANITDPTVVDRAMTLTLEYTVDNGSTWHPLAVISKKYLNGVYEVNCGVDLIPEVYAAASIDVRVDVAADSHSSEDQATIAFYLGK